MIPQIANRLISRYSQPNDLILDPFCGSGTVLLESKILGRNAIGVDINPLAILLSNVKTSHISNLQRELLENFFKKLKQSRYKEELNEYLPEFENLNYWFTEKTIKDLLIIKYHLLKNKFSKEISNFLQICFSKTIQEVSKGEFDGSSTHLKKNLQNFSPKAFAIFEKNVISTFKIIKNFKVEADSTENLALTADSRNIPLKKDSIDCIVTSPPYGEEMNTIGYMRWTKFSLFWLGYSSKDLRKLKKKTLGFKNTNKEFNKSKSLTKFIKKLELPNKRIDIIHSFFYDYYLCLKEMLRTLKSGKYCCIVIGNRTIDKKPLFLDIITTELAENMGFEHINTFYRHIPTKTIPWSGISGKTIKRENILIFKKPQK